MKTRDATIDEVNSIIELSVRVQDALTAAGSMQTIGPLFQSSVLTEVAEQRCFVLEDTLRSVIGCAFIKPIEEASLPRIDSFQVNAYPEPWLYMHSVMLEPHFQGKCIGLEFFAGVINLLRPQGGAVLLDCWAGNAKLRSFYERTGCSFVAILPEDDFEVALFSHGLDQDNDYKETLCWLHWCSRVGDWVG